LARYIGPVCRALPARGHEAFFLKGSRLLQRQMRDREAEFFLPASTARIASRRSSAMVCSWREKQKAKRYYSLPEVQFRNLFEKASRQKACDRARTCWACWSGRLDNIIHRIGFGASRGDGAPNWFGTATSPVNGKKVKHSRPTSVRPNDVVEVRPNSHTNAAVTGSLDATAHLPAPNWIEVDRENLKDPYPRQPGNVRDLVQDQAG